MGSSYSIVKRGGGDVSLRAGGLFVLLDRWQSLLDEENVIAYDVVRDIIRNEEIMASYTINLPDQLKRDAERLATKQGVSLNQFILWSVAEKVGGLLQGLDDPNFPGITFRRGASGSLAPVLRGTGIRVQTLVIAADHRPVPEIAEEYDLTEIQVREALAYYEAHRIAFDAYIKAESELEPGGQ